MNKKEGRKFASMEYGEVYVVTDGVNLMGSCFVKTWGTLNREQVSHCTVEEQLYCMDGDSTTNQWQCNHGRWPEANMLDNSINRDRIV